jgi:predicted dehydrogenase
MLQGNSKRLGVGFVGSGFVTRFHIRSWVGVRDADIRGIWSPNQAHAGEAAALARALGVGEAQAYPSLRELVRSPEIDALWICIPNDRRVATVEEIVEVCKSGGGHLVGLACEKPLARTVAEARRMLQLVEETGLRHGYLENQVFAPAMQRGKEIIWQRGAALTGRPYLARAAEEHSGPHSAWFWQGSRQGGGVLNDMMCHSLEAARFLLTAPGAARDALRPLSVTAQIASLKWSRPEYVQRLRETMGPQVDYQRAPAEDFARASILLEDPHRNPLIIEATTSWSFVGPGLRLTMELLGPEYSLSINTLDSPLKVFFSRHVRGSAGEDLVEKQNAESGLMPVVEDEAAAYGYTAENRHMVRQFLAGDGPAEDWRDGLDVVALLMTCYMAAELGHSLDFPPPGLDTFVPQVARGTWKPR